MKRLSISLFVVAISALALAPGIAFAQEAGVSGGIQVNPPPGTDVEVNPPPGGTDIRVNPPSGSVDSSAGAVGTGSAPYDSSYEDSESAMGTGTAKDASRTHAYTVFKGGAFFPQASDVEDFDNGWSAEFAIGTRIVPMLDLELGVGWFEIKHDVAGGGEEKIRAIPATATIKIPFTLGPVEPYIEGGGGAYFVRAEAPGQGEDNDTVFGYHAGAGLNFNLTPNVFIGAEGRYIWVEPSVFGTDVKLDGINATGNIGFRF